VVLLAYGASSRARAIHVKPTQRLELLTLLVATGYAFCIPLKRTLSLLDTVVLGGLFVLYIRDVRSAFFELFRVGWRLGR